MELPKSVEEAANLGEELHAKLYPQPEQAVEETIPDTEEVQDVNDDEHEVIPHDDDVAELRKFKEQYLSLKGKYDAEVPRLHNELKEFKQNVFDRLEQARKPETPETPEPQEDRFAKFKEEYGEELFEAMKELASLTAEEKMTAKLQPVSEQVASVEDTQIKVAQQNFISYLEEKVTGDWKPFSQTLHELKNGLPVSDTRIADFFTQPDPSGLHTYGALFNGYNDAWDADKMALIINQYYGTPEPKPEPKPKPERDAMVAPSRSTQHTTPPINDKRIWTTDAMSEFQRKDRRGDYTPEESKAMWDDLLAAANEGRIR